jgi:GntR family transcriptional regulator/MocR family aminotransferase
MSWEAIQNDNTDLPLYEIVYQRLRDGIRTGLIRGRLPSKNQAAARLKVSKVTIEQAYNQLKAEGYIQARPRSGHFVEYQHIAGSEQNIPPRPVFAAEQSAVFDYDLSTYAVAAESFPFAVWSRLSRKVLSEEGEKLVNSTPSKGILSLRQEIALYLQAYRDIQVHPEQILVGAGTEWVCSLFVQLFGPGQRFAIENPGYGKIWRILAAHGVPLVRIAMRDNGIDLAELQRAKPDVVHITPSHHFPLGTVMPVQQRQALLNLAEQLDFYIIEDDYDSEFRFVGRPIPALKSLDHSSRVIYINTFAKSLAPSLRISYMVLPPTLLEKYEKELSFYSCTVPGFEQYVMSRFMSEGHFSRHLNRMKTLYKSKHDALIERLEQSLLGQRLRISGKSAGLHFLLQLNGKLSEKEMLAKALEQGIKLNGLSEFYSQKKGIPRSTVVLGFARVPDNSIAELVKKLEKAWGRDE